jgi:hypothetical protein
MTARWPAISARRSRRIISSLLPLNIGPQTTSSQPPLFGGILITGGAYETRRTGAAHGREAAALGVFARSGSARRNPTLRKQRWATRPMRSRRIVATLGRVSLLSTLLLVTSLLLLAAMVFGVAGPLAATARKR